MHNSGFDWNGNGKSDRFDDYMNYTLSQSGKPASGNRHRSPAANRRSASPSDWQIALRCIIVIALCVAALVLPLAMGMGKFVTGICLILSVLLGCIILCAR